MSKMGKLISRKIDKAIFENRMIEENDKILLAVSGGKDSLTMAYFLGKKQHKFRYPFTAEAVHIRTDFEGCFRHPKMDDFFNEWNIKIHYIDVPILERLKPGRKMNCYWCATQRRKELMEFARNNGFTKIALGHHLDDILETFFMNMILKGEMSTMLPILKYDHYDNTVIRPLARVQEHEIIGFAEEMGIREIAASSNL